LAIGITQNQLKERCVLSRARVRQQTSSLGSASGNRELHLDDWTSASKRPYRPRHYRRLQT
jgi:hypothetical protein